MSRSGGPHNAPQRKTATIRPMWRLLKALSHLQITRAGDRTRTGDVQLGKLAFYQLNYARSVDQLTEQMSSRKGWSFRLTVVARHLGASADTSADALLAPLVSLFGSTQPGRTKWHV